MESSTEASSEAPSAEWPAKLAPAAFHGPLGELVRTIEPHTEADEAALLVHALVIFGNCLGPGWHFYADGARHTPVLYAAVVGETAKARKGTALAKVRGPLGEVDPDLAQPGRIKNGLSSGEGLIWEVRDGKGEEGALVDKRRLIIEPELASVLQNFARQGNTLSAVLRAAWDGGTVSIMTKKSPVAATNPHLSLIGHTTMFELRKLLSQTEMVNGFSNRVLWACARRSKVLPEGGQVDPASLEEPIRQLQVGLTLARTTPRELQRTRAAVKLWANVYPTLSEGASGLFGAVTSRAEAQVLRLAAIYAAGDISYFVGSEHLNAALAVWAYCRASAFCLFGARVNDPDADKINKALINAGSNGLTRTDISHLFGQQ